ncbi:DUF1269 domain-containing protein [Actinacidiphila soli]|uniref:DUF1269 domain-containing protein n=1 Tax=Actinacidiphila soli TaxID=2487275 RepID=UPI000FCB9FE5|nr:DUF1269 domain-containing protein [Actinacidiphila soli]
MATLTVWKFPTPEGADEAVGTLESLQKQELIKVHDAAVVSWPPDKKQPKTRQLHNLAGVGALSGSFWGLLFGMLFFVPLLGMAVGAAVGAMSGSMADVGINDDFIESVRRQVTPGSSALFLLSSDAVLDKVRDPFGSTQVELLSTNLSGEEEAKLREVFSEQ